MKLCEPFCKNWKFWHSFALGYYPTLIMSIFWHQHGNEWFTRICTEPSFCPSEIWLLLLDGSCPASWKHFECWEFMRFASDIQHGSFTPATSAESKVFILSGWEKALMINLKTKHFHFFWGWGEGADWVAWVFFLKLVHTINTIVFKSPWKILFLLITTLMRTAV